MPKKPKAEKLRSMAELLWVFDKQEAENETAVQVRKELSKTQVKTPTEAGKIAGMYKLHHGGLDANERSKVIGLIQLGRTGTGVGEKGDFVWIVRYILWGNSVSQEFWINAETGKVHPILQNP